METVIHKLEGRTYITVRTTVPAADCKVKVEGPMAGTDPVVLQEMSPVLHVDLAEPGVIKGRVYEERAMALRGRVGRLERYLRGTASAQDLWTLNEETSGVPA